MTNDQIRLHFGELNAAEMRLARAIVGWFEHRQAQLNHDWADTDTAVRETCRKAGLDVDGTPTHVPDIPELVEKMAAQNAKLRAAADGLAEALEQVISADTTIYWSGDESPPTKEEGDCAAIARTALAAYQATKQP
jgi:hypothetical protein